LSNRKFEFKKNELFSYFGIIIIYQYNIMVLGLYMKRIYRYSGIMALSFSLVMFSVGSIPQANAGSVASTIVVNITCGMTLAGVADFGSGIIIGANLVNANLAAVPTIENTGVASTPIAVEVGTNTGGGYQEGGTTHIAPSDIDMKIAGSTFNAGAFQTLDDAGTDTNLGPLGPASGATNLEFQVFVSGINLGATTDPNWSATYTFTAGTCFL